MATPIREIIMPTRPQVDTVLAVFLLKTFGEEAFPGISKAVCGILPKLPEGKNSLQLEAEGKLLIDVGGGKFDHHGRAEKITACDLIARHLHIENDPSLKKLFELARRDDFFGKGTLSEDPLDRAFGFPGLLAAMNKEYPSDPNKVIDFFQTLIRMHHREETRRTKELPEELAKKMTDGGMTKLEVKQRDKKLKVAIVESDNVSMPGFLRAREGGGFDVVLQIRTTGHVNILTRQIKRIDLRSLAVIIRTQENTLSPNPSDFPPRLLAEPGRLDDIPEWYYDTATNSIQNGGTSPQGISPTRIKKPEWPKLLEVGLSESLWSPMRR
ncbi:MAG: hypothetical protein Q7R93_03795 [bacterium]|nr:hypothetical protein [bacterium]